MPRDGSINYGSLGLNIQYTVYRVYSNSRSMHFDFIDREPEGLRSDQGRLALKFVNLQAPYSSCIASILICLSGNSSNEARHLSCLIKYGCVTLSGGTHSIEGSDSGARWHQHLHDEPTCPCSGWCAQNDKLLFDHR